jgi:peptide/nickel transport system substrate-binding protein
MMGLSRKGLLAPALVGGLALVGSLVPAAHTSAQSSPVYLNAFYQFKTTMIRDFNPFDVAGQMDWTTNEIYEPLLVVNVPPATNGMIYPWLASAYSWTNGNKTLVLTARSGVKWSDGQPFTAQDIAFTFNYGKAHAVADQQGLWAGKYITSVTAKGNKVYINLANVDTTILRTISLVNIIPQHIWASISNPAAFQNPNPVGTGTFTQVTDFTPQGFTLTKNPYTWQPSVAYDGIHDSSFSGNDAANLAMVDGQLDWTGNFVPNIQKVYVSKDPAHFHYDYASEEANGLWMNDQLYPYSLPDFRKALSHAIDRQKLYTIAEYGYQKPSDVIGLAGPFPQWADPSLAAAAQEAATYNIAEGKAILAKASFTWKGGKLYDPKGSPVTITLSVINGWSDWVLGMQIMQKGFEQLGIPTTINLMTQPDWYSQSGKGTLPGGGLQLHWPQAGATPYNFYESFMSQESYTPFGVDVNTTGWNNWERYFSPEATNYLRQFRATSDLALQKKLIDQVQAIQLQDMPYIPTTYAADWYTYSTLHFTGFPTPDNFYTSGSPNDHWSNVLVISRLKPVQ